MLLDGPNNNALVTFNISYSVLEETLTAELYEADSEIAEAWFDQAAEYWKQAIALTPGPSISQTTTPFGTLYVFHDPLTLKANSNSKIVGTAEGTSITSSLNGLQSISIAKITLMMNHYKGSISVVGGTHNTKPSNHPVVGGTGDFLFVQGYVTSSPVDLSGITVTYKIQFHLYWPPYAIPSHPK
ncbi:dirigent protein 19-like [Solanum verrucosum]|uniref:dirigent protein 19-like n=1 Tax=Solanum verrucosum TaxID=315347 RepID=UPI0020D0896C|nr:dirigent protein 19-like [Solanum verrucosum]